MVDYDYGNNVGPIRLDNVITASVGFEIVNTLSIWKIVIMAIMLANNL